MAIMKNLKREKDVTIKCLPRIIYTPQCVSVSSMAPGLVIEREASDTFGENYPKRRIYRSSH